MRFTAILVSLGLICGCADSNPVRPTAMPPPPSSQTPPASDIVTPSLNSISPTSAMVGSSDLTLQVIGTNFMQFQNHISSLVTWTATGTERILNTRFVSTTELMAVVPAALLSQAGTARVFVQNGDSMGISDGYNGYPKSNSIDFNVIPSAAGVAWNGNSTVESVTGSTPDCMPSFWSQGFVQPMSVTFMEAAGRNGQPLLYLSQPVSVEACRLEYHGTSVGIEARAYYSDPMNDASDCHFRVISAGCRGQVWLLDPRLNAVFTDATRTRLNGSLEMPYDVSASNGTGWIRVTLVKRFEITKISP